MATEDETDNHKSEGGPGLGGSAVKSEERQKDRESINPDGTKGNRKEISSGESLGKAGGSRQGTQETKEGRNKDRTSPRNSEGAVSKKVRVTDARRKLAEIEKKTAEYKTRLIEEMMIGNEEDPLQEEPRDERRTGRGEIGQGDKGSDSGGTPSKKRKERENSPGIEAEKATNPSAIDSRASRLPTTPVVTRGCEGLWSLRERVLGWFDPKGTAKTREGQKASKEGQDTSTAGEASSYEGGLRKIVSSLARALNKNQGYLADAKKKLTFDWANITEFLIDYENLAVLLKWIEEKKMDHLGQHVSLSLGRDKMAIVAASRSWKETRDVMKRKYLAAEKMAMEVDLAAVQRKNFATYIDFLREFTLVALRIPRDLEKAFADIRLSLPDREGGEVMRAPLATKLSCHTLPVGKLKIQIGTHHTDTLVDEGVERRDFAMITGCMVNKKVTGSIRGASGEISFVGYVTKCAVKAGIRESIWSFQRMTVMEKMDHDIILGRPWCANVEMIGMHLHDGTYMVDIEDPVTGRGELLRLLGTGGNPPKGKLATWSPSFEDNPRKGAFARMESMRERVEIMIEEAFNKKEWIKMGLPQKKRRQEDEVLGVMVAEKESKVELGDNLSKRKEVRMDVSEAALDIPDLLQLIKALTYNKEEAMEKEEEVLRVIQERRATEGHRIPDEVANTMKIGINGFLTEEETRLIKKTCQEFHLAFAFSDHQKGRLDAKLIPPVRIHTVEHECWNDKGPSYEFGIVGEVTDLLRAKMDSFVAEPMASPYANWWFVFRKPNKALRWIQDLQKLNAVTIRDAGSLPQTDLLAESHAGRSIYSLIDMYSGYDQLPLDVRDRPYTAMHTPIGQLQMQVTPMGFTNAVAEARRRMYVVVGDMFPDKCDPYINDNPIKGAQEKDETKVQPGIRRFVWDDLQDIKDLLRRFLVYNITASGPKSILAVPEVTTVGFRYGAYGRKPDLAKTDKISQWPTPLRMTTEVRAFLGVVNFWRIFIKFFANIAESIRAMIREEGTMDWTEEREGAVQTLKDILTSEKVALSAPCFNDEVGQPFILETDIGPLAVGGELIQRDEEGKKRSIWFESRTLNSAERWYSRFKKEVLAILHCLKTFQAYLFRRQFILRIDPTNVAEALKNYRPIDPTVGRWVGFIRQFDYKFERIAEIRNKADGLSRVCITPEGVKDAEPIDVFLEYEGGTLAVENEMMGEGCTSGELLIRTLEKGAPAVVAELREGPVTTRGRKEEKDLWGEIVGPKEELIAMAVEGGRDAVMSLVESWEKKELRWMAVTLKKKTGKSVADWIEDFCIRHPFIRRFIADNGIEFVNQEVLGMLKRLYVPIKLIEPYYSDANAPVERGHRTLKNTIAKLAADHLGSWPKYLKQAVFSENMTPKRTTGCIPTELWYRREIDFPVEALIPTWNRLDDDQRMTTEELIEARCQQVLKNEEGKTSPTGY
ncbi:hypothetical protein CBR_g31081 [Chara braunii]|uniref:Integrase catalytic domain-containing protein n=1 Tax=Chara braunii TaxID=69332 RepID=A0A388LE95_CHABU|nr:hypothetical protein CBR_g31081 [Chara braunii]|eukprot:GBG80621.1 hypothetical protein CBR_g31081 [Chara braunii]